MFVDNGGIGKVCRFADDRNARTLDGVLRPLSEATRDYQNCRTSPCL